MFVDCAGAQNDKGGLKVTKTIAKADLLFTKGVVQKDCSRLISLYGPSCTANNHGALHSPASIMVKKHPMQYACIHPCHYLRIRRSESLTRRCIVADYDSSLWALAK
jgi:hypothetical protein